MKLCQVKTDRASGIVNDTNDWCTEQGNPRRIVDLVKRIAAASVKATDIARLLSTIPAGAAAARGEGV